MQLQVIQNKIYEVRDVKVMLDFDLAELYTQKEWENITGWSDKWKLYKENMLDKKAGEENKSHEWKERVRIGFDVKSK